MDISFYQEFVKPLLVQDSSTIINWMKNEELLRKELFCMDCGGEMMWARRVRCIDNYAWKCTTKSCKKRDHYVSIRKDSFFYHSKLSLQNWIEAMFYWCVGLSVTQVTELMNLSRVTVIDVFNFFRKICCKHFEMHPIRLGGAGKRVEINESCFSLSLKPKHHRGRANHSPVWVFGIVDLSMSPPLGYMEIVESKSAEALLPIVLKVVNPGTTIHSEQWEGYHYIQGDLGSDHQTVNQSLHFVEPATGVDRETVEVYWNKQEQRIRRLNGCKTEFLDSYLKEEMWRERHKQDMFSCFCYTISSQYRFNHSGNLSSK